MGFGVCAARPPCRTQRFSGHAAGHPRIFCRCSGARDGLGSDPTHSVSSAFVHRRRFRGVYPRYTSIGPALFSVFRLAKMGIALTPFQVGVIGLGLHYSTYLAESYRAGIDAVPKGQWEAAAALNLSAKRTWLRVVLPQAVPPVLPQLGNYLIMMFKESVLVSAVGLVEALGMADMIGAQNFRNVEPYTIVGLLFLAVSYPSAIGVRYLERRTQKAFGAKRQKQKEAKSA